MAKQLTTEEFIKRARMVHGDRYDYSQTIYRKSKEEVDITCPIHGLFRQTAISHLCGHGCPKCGIVSCHNIQRRNTESFIAKAREIHGDRYDYSNVEYAGSYTQVEIICRKHGAFKQTPVSHLSGHGCYQCSLERSSEGRTHTTQLFITMAQTVHGCEYNYNELVYASSKAKVKIICPKHGAFWQTPSNHLKGHGCPMCKLEKMKSRLYGVGLNDCIKAKRSKAYRCWYSMLSRCYSTVRFQKDPSYKGCSVCDEWLTFSNFKKWFDDNYVEGYSLDKDIISKGNRVYAPNMCCFIPVRINSLIVNRRRDRGKYPVGVTEHFGKFYVYVNINGKQTYIGKFLTVAEAFETYKETKERYIKEIALDYYKRGKITKRVYDAMMRYEIEITD